MTWAQDYNIKNGLPSETYITCAEANEMAKTDSAQVAEIVAVMGNASVASRDLKLSNLRTERQSGRKTESGLR
ncbi:protein [Escherichia coli]|uniref:Protein n=1 Tax=Escherichia coli TaxID=562 RepID=A0A376X0Q4_ECOLX|nr:protein [Escherichia coli]